MSNNKEWYEDDDDLELDDDLDQDSAMRNVRKAERAKSKRIKELETELETLRKFQRDSVLSSVLNEKGINPKIAALIPATVASDPEAINTWLSEYGEIFGVKPTQQNATNSISPEELALMREMDAVTSNASVPDGVNDINSAIKNAQSAEEIYRLFGVE
jgi:hypothetical protein